MKLSPNNVKRGTVGFIHGFVFEPGTRVVAVEVGGWVWWQQVEEVTLNRAHIVVRGKMQTNVENSLG